MKLRKKISIIVFILWFIAVAATFIGSQHILRTSYLDLERNNANNNTIRVQEALSQMVYSVATIASDWSVWDESYYFMGDHNDKFIKTNLIPGSLLAANADMILMYDTTGKLIESAALDETKEKIVPPPAALIEYLKTSSFINLPHEDSKARGIILLPEGIIMIASHAIVKSNKTGPVRGAIVMGHYLTEELIQKIRDITKVNAFIYVLPVIQKNAELNDIYQQLQTQKFINKTDDKIINSYRLLFDVEKHPVAMIKVAMPRTIYLTGSGTINYYNIIFLTYSIIFSAVLWYLLQILIVRRIEQFTTRFNFTPENEALLVSFINQASDEISLASSLYHQAMHDPLTGLANRNLLYEIFEYSIHRVKKNQKIVLLFFDIDRFKRVNDTLGHSVGDNLLICAARRLQASLRRGDVAARLGGDEFIVLLVDVEKELIKSAVERVYHELIKPVVIQGHEVPLLSSVGISVYPDDDDNIDGLINKADIALYHAKETGRNHYEFYSRELKDRLQVAHKKEADLQRAIDQHEFSIYYQPIYDVHTRKLVSLEALLRWNHPENGLLSAGEIIPVAEKTGLIVTIGEWVFNSVCKQIALWERNNVPVVPVAVNMSPTQAMRGSIHTMISGILKTNNISPKYLELELTETGFVEITEEILNELHVLKNLGIQLSVDDFGTGYSGLRYLKSLPVNKIKIDKSFIKDILTNPDDRAITLAIIDVAHQLNLKVIAEGVETNDQFVFLKEHGVDLVQGHYFCKPLDSENCEKILLEQTTLAIS